MMIVPRQDVDPAEDWAERWEVIGRALREERPDVQETGDKRKAKDTDEQSTKRARLSPSITDDEPTKLDGESTKPDSDSIKPDQEIITCCKLPPPNPIAQQILNSLKSTPLTDPLESKPKGDVFLLPDARENICTCPNVRLLSFA
jgi:hypothetical protein